MSDKPDCFEGHNNWEFDYPYPQNQHESLVEFILHPDNDRAPYSAIKDGVLEAVTEECLEWNPILLDYVIELDVARWIFRVAVDQAGKRKIASTILGMIQTRMLFGNPSGDVDSDQPNQDDGGHTDEF